jgi:hypothetical protein
MRTVQLNTVFFGVVYVNVLASVLGGSALWSARKLAIANLTKKPPSVY